MNVFHDRVRRVLVMGLVLAAPLGLSGSWAAVGDWNPPVPVEAADGIRCFDFELLADSAPVAVFSDRFQLPQKALAQRFSPEFVPLGPPMVLVDGIERGYSSVFEPDLLIGPDGVLNLLWRVGSGPNRGLWFQRFTDKATPTSEPIRLGVYSSGIETASAIDIEGGEIHVQVVVGRPYGLDFFRVRISDGALVSNREIFPVADQRAEDPRLVPRRDGTMALLFKRVDLSFSGPRVLYMAHIDRNGEPLGPAHAVTPLEGEVVGGASALFDDHDLLHVVTTSVTDEGVVRDQVHFLRAAVLDTTGAFHLQRELARTRGFAQFSEPQIVLNSIGGVDLILNDQTEAPETRARGLRVQAAFARPEIIRQRFDESYAIVESDRIVDDQWPRWLDFRPDGRGGIIGTYRRYESPTGDDRLQHDFVRTRDSATCRDGMLKTPAFSINGDTGGPGHLVRVRAGEAADLAMAHEAGLPGFQFYVQARLGTPEPGDPRSLGSVGTACFDFFDFQSAFGIWNALGSEGTLGSSIVDGQPIANPTAAPGSFYILPGELTSLLGPGTEITFHGLRSDRESPPGISTTNAITLSIEP